MIVACCDGGSMKALAGEGRKKERVSRVMNPRCQSFMGADFIIFFRTPIYIRD
jgi:hypothetical protein